MGLRGNWEYTHPCCIWFPFYLARAKRHTINKIMSTRSSFPFAQPTILGVPLEIRGEIYSHLPIIPTPIQIPKLGPKTNPALSTPSLEAGQRGRHDVLYRENTFQFLLNGCTRKHITAIHPRNRSLVRKFESNSKFPADRDVPPVSLDDWFWASVVAKLTKLALITHYQLFRSLPVLPLTLEDMTAAWIDWLRTPVGDVIFLKGRYWT